MKSCFFIGHREAPDSIRPVLERAIEFHITEFGVKHFCVGNYGRFDRLTQSALAQAKLNHPDITIQMLLPYHPSEHKIDVPLTFDGSFYPPGMETVPYHAAIARANRYMADTSDYIIAYVWHTASNAWSVLEYARKRGAHIENLAKESK